MQVPATRLHLVSVGLGGQARLKLQPHFERVDGQVVRHDSPPVYDAPPTLDDLFDEAAKNHQLAHEFRSARVDSREPIVTVGRKSPATSLATPRSARWCVRSHATPLLHGHVFWARDV